MSQTIQVTTFKEISGGKYDIHSHKHDSNNLNQFLNNNYRPGKINQERNIIGDFHGMVGYSNSHIHHFFLFSELLTDKIIRIYTQDDEGSKDVFQYDVNLEYYYVLINVVKRVDGAQLSFTYLHPIYSKELQKRMGINISGISIVPPAETNNRTTKVSEEFYRDTIALFDQLEKK